MAIVNLTILFILTLVVAIAVFDVYIIFKKGKYESISAHIIRASHRHPSIPFLIGFVAGHLFWSMDTASWSIP
jgi:type III secretory pathway component EscT